MKFAPIGITPGERNKQGALGMFSAHVSFHDDGEAMSFCHRGLTLRRAGFKVNKL